MKTQFGADNLLESNEYDLEEYIWSIHKYIDASVILTKFKNGGYAYAPYVPSMLAMYADADNFSKHLYGNTIIRPESHFSVWAST